MDPLHHISNQYRLLTYWYESVLDGVSEEHGRHSPDGRTNSIGWLAGHLIVGRYRNLVRLGVQVEPYPNLDKFVNQTLPPPNALAFDSNIHYPGLTECREQWAAYSKLLMQALNNPDQHILNSEIPFTVLTGGNTVEDALAFMLLHETYHIGQMSIMRKALGYPSMKLAPGK